MTRMIGRLTAALLTTAALVAGVNAASAHVSVSSTDAAQGGYGLMTFRVPNESDSAATTELTITLPEETPLAHLTVQAKPGWKVTTRTTTFDEPVAAGQAQVTEAVTSVTWTATDGGIPVGGFDTFALSGGPLPEVDELVLPATQRYADGEVVEWSEVAEGDTEPAHPAPVLALTEHSGDGHQHGTASAEQGSDDDSGPDPFALAALALAAVALVVSLAKNRSRAS